MRYVVTLGLLLTVAGLAQADPLNFVSLSNLPPAVREAADATAQAANQKEVKWLFAVRRSNGYYCLLGKNQLRAVDYICDGQGKDGYIRVEMPIASVPGAVKMALARRMPYFKPFSVQMCSINGREVIVYRFQGEGYEGGNAGVYVSPSGQKVTPIK